MCSYITIRTADTAFTAIIVDTSTYASNKCVTIDFGVIGKKALSLDYAPITFVNEE